MGWMGLGLLLVSSYLFSARRRQAWLWSLAGNLAWLVRGFQTGQADLVVETALFAALAAWGWWRWRRP